MNFLIIYKKRVKQLIIKETEKQYYLEPKHIMKMIKKD